MQGSMIDAPLNPSRHLSDPFDIAPETRTKEVHFSAYPKSSLINKNWRTSELFGKENKESQNCDNGISLYSQVYADTLLSRQLQNRVQLIRVKSRCTY